MTSSKSNYCVDLGGCAWLLWWNWSKLNLVVILSLLCSNFRYGVSLGPGIHTVYIKLRAKGPQVSERLFTKKSLYSYRLMYFHGIWKRWSLGRVARVTSTEVRSEVTYRSVTFGLCFGEKKWSLYPHKFVMLSWAIHIPWVVCECDNTNGWLTNGRTICRYAGGYTWQN